MITVKSDLINSYLERIDKAVVVFSSETCPTCQKLKTSIPILEDRYPDITFIYLDGNKFNNSADLYDIIHFPTVIYFDSGVEVKRVITGDIKKIEKLWN